MRAAAALACLALAGCVVSWGCPGEGEIGALGWTQPGLYAALGDVRTPWLDVSESSPQRGLDAGDIDLFDRWPRATVQTLGWSDAKSPEHLANISLWLMPGPDTGSARLQATVIEPHDARFQEAVVAFLEDVGAPGNMSLGALRANESMSELESGQLMFMRHAVIAEPRGIATLYRSLGGHGTADVQLDSGATLRWGAWWLHAEIPDRRVRFDNDASGATPQAFDDDLPYVRLHARADGSVVLAREGARFGTDLGAVTDWANATFERHGLPAPTLAEMWADRAWCG